MLQICLNQLGCGSVETQLLSCLLRKDQTEWLKYQAKKSKRLSMMHVVSVQHMKEQNAKGDEWL